jgi:hypothetical protein
MCSFAEAGRLNLPLQLSIRNYLICKLLPLKKINRLLLLAFCFTCFLLLTENSKAQKQVTIPAFLDNGKTVDSLQQIHGAQEISYEKWDKRESDSCLSVCLINSQKVPIGVEASSHFIKMASAIKKALKKPGSYKSIYIIFVIKDIVNGMEIKIHTSGMDVLLSEL